MHTIIIYINRSINWNQRKIYYTGMPNKREDKYIKIQKSYQRFKYW